MFQFKNASSDNQALFIPPNNPAEALTPKTRTFKEDLEKFQKTGKVEDVSEAEISISGKDANGPRAEETLPQEQPISQTALFAPRKEVVPGNPFQSIPAPPPPSTSNTSLPQFNSTPSQSFFAEKPAPFAENGPVSDDKKNLKFEEPKKGHGGLFLLIFLLILIAGGVGGYYYWFFMKNNTFSILGYTIGKTITLQKEPEKSTLQSAAPESKNQSLKRLVVDSLDNQGISSALQKFATDFSSSTSDNQLVEIKLLDKNNQAIGKKDFASGFGAKIPDAALSKLSDEYSLFAKKEGTLVRLGLVFKTVTSSGLPEEMKKWEPTMISDLGNLYSSQVQKPTSTAFKASRYKNADIRYFNFSSPAGTSLDYSVISNFLIIGTSKDTTRAILDYMSEK